MSRRLTVRRESFPLREAFRISRGSKTEAQVLLVEIAGGGATGRGECVPYARYGESLDSVAEQIEALAGDVAGGLDRAGLATRLSAGAARNAIDCALWDWEAKRAGRRAWELAGLPAPRPAVTAFTLSLDTPDATAAAAARAAHRPLLKIKLGGDGDRERVAAVRQAAPDAALIVDANEAWRPDDVESNIAAMADLGVALIEQPLPAGRDAVLAQVDRPVPVCADESCHVRADLAGLAGRYDAVNVKLDKSGGLTEALALAAEARSQGFRLMVGCMVGSSLAMAPALLLAGEAEWLDLDGPLLLARDRQPALAYDNATVGAPEAALWG